MNWDDIYRAVGEVEVEVANLEGSMVQLRRMQADPPTGSRPVTWSGHACLMEEQWPPPNHKFAYTMNVELERPPLSYSMEVTTPARPNEASADSASVRYERLGGPVAADFEFRGRLYERIGAVTVAGGHAEAAMKRVVLTAELKGESFNDVDLTWRGLVKRLQRIAGSEHEIAEPLRSMLAWAERAKIKTRRDDVVHAYWWHWANVGVSRSRFNRDGSSYIVSGTVDDLSKLERDAAMIFEYARRLDDLVVSTWPRRGSLEIIRFSEMSRPSAVRPQSPPITRGLLGWSRALIHRSRPPPPTA